MRWIKTSERLPTLDLEEVVIFNKFNKGNINREIVCIEDEMDIEYIKENADEWLDESEEEITNTMRLDWLENNLTIKLYLDTNNIREFIDKQIKRE